MKNISELGITAFPWHVPMYKFSTNYGKIISSPVRTVEGGFKLKVVASPNPNIKESDQNAVLMASSPDLYECLMESVDCYCRRECGVSASTECCQSSQSVCPARKWRILLDRICGDQTLSDPVDDPENIKTVAKLQEALHNLVEESLKTKATNAAGGWECLSSAIDKATSVLWESNKSVKSR